MNWELLSTFYTKTTFKIFVDTNNVVKIRVGIFSEELLTLFALNKQNTGCFITAYNPRSEGELTSSENEKLNGFLEQELEKRNLCYLNACGEGDFDSSLPKQWDPEISFFVFGLDKIEALELGKKYEQNAVIFCSKELPPELLRCLFN